LDEGKLRKDGFTFRERKEEFRLGGNCGVERRKKKSNLGARGEKMAIKPQRWVGKE